ncbi:MAG: sulfite exporter TauE/SafE family protein [Bacteroidales bacterium]|nr:sulfite exporter TauE/SafE family protein [Bacteroidales bacterium]
MDINILFVIIGVVFISTLTRSTFGFGDALIAMPLLALFIDIKIATPLVALIAFFIAISILIRSWQRVEIKSAWRLIVSSLIGIPIGLWFLDDINENIIKLVLGIIVLFFAIYSLVKPKLHQLKGEKLSWLFGFIAGILGGAYNTNGPPIVIYSSLKKWNPENFRATLQGYFFTTGILVITGHGIAGNFTKEVLLYFICTLPIVILAIYLGRIYNKRISHNFYKYIYIILIVIGSLLIYNSINNII